MNSIRTMIVVTVLAAVGYGLYVSTHKTPVATPPAGAEGQELTEAPLVQLPPEPGPAQMGTAAPPPVAEAAPPFEPVAEAPLAPEAAPVDVTAAAEAPPTGAVPYTDALPADAGAWADAPPAAVAAPEGGYEVAPAAADPALVVGAPPAGDPYAASPQPSAVESQATAATWEAPSGEAAAEFAAVLAGIDQLLAANRLADAQLELSRWYDDPRFTPEQQTQVLDLLDQLTGTVLYSTEHYLEPPYEVQPGDSLDRIAERYQVSWQLLAKINGMSDPSQLQPGSQLKVVQGPFSAYVELAKYRLTLWLNGRYAGRFSIGVGRDQAAAEGEFTVVNKLENPGFQAADATFDANDPNNPLGERWIDLGSAMGIHGTNDLSAIGRDQARGCISLAPTDVEDVYDTLVAGSRVMIRR